MIKQKENPLSIDSETIIELISIKGKTTYLSEMKYKEALQILKNKKAGWTYIIYQKGFSQFKNTRL